MWSSSLDMAYGALGIDDGASLADEDVGVAYYKSGSRDALKFIAEARQSRFLRFLATIGQHLDDKNVAVLAKKNFATSTEPENIGETSNDTGLVGEGLASGESTQNLPAASPKSEKEMDAYGEHYAPREHSPSEPRSPSSSEASFSSSDGTGADSDFSEEFCGIFFDHTLWRCEECCGELVDWNCPNRHNLRRCNTCGSELDNGSCEKCQGKCGDCGGEKIDGQCCNCEVDEGSEDEDIIAFDEKDGLWRCISCQWEVEANNDTDDNCHCMNDKGEAHFIDISDCLDYDPADSCSSADDSTDSEGDSDDEGFIDDTEIPSDDSDSNAAIETVHLAEIAKGAAKVKDKENIKPTAMSDDIEIIDTPTANGPPKLPSNIVDCESMDM